MHAFGHGGMRMDRMDDVGNGAKCNEIEMLFATIRRALDTVG